MVITHILVPALGAQWLVSLRVRVGAGAGAVARATGVRDDGRRENVQEKEERVQDEDQSQAPVDGALQRGHEPPQIRASVGSLRGLHLEQERLFLFRGEGWGRASGAAHVVPQESLRVWSNSCCRHRDACWPGETDRQTAAETVQI